MRPRKALLTVMAFTMCLLPLACGDGRISSEEAKELIAAKYDPAGLVEITTKRIWRKTGCQLFKITEGANLETFAFKDGQAVRIGKGFGGKGVTSVIAEDINNDGKVELIYAFSWGGGMFSPVIAWMDLADNTEYSVGQDEQFDMSELILKREKGEIAVYGISEPGEKSRLGALLWQDDDLRYISTE